MVTPFDLKLKLIYYIAWLQAVVATIGSLFLSEVLHWTPCVLCWYQRILMYPLVLIIGVGILLKDRNLPRYVLPLTALGWCIALYHSLLQWRIIPDSLAPCQAGISCTTKFFALFGFITIPFLSFTAFSVISACMIIVYKKLLKS